MSVASSDESDYDSEDDNEYHNDVYFSSLAPFADHQTDEFNAQNAHEAIKEVNSWNVAAPNLIIDWFVYLFENDFIERIKVK